MTSQEIKNIFKDNDGNNFIIHTDEPYFDKENNCITYKDYFGNTSYTFGSETKTYTTLVLDYKENYIILQCFENDFHYKKHLDVKHITSIDFSFKSKFENRLKWYNDKWNEDMPNRHNVDKV